MAKLTHEEQLEKISGWLEQIFGSRLKSLLVYGSAAGGNHHGRHSDINLLAILDTVDAGTLDSAAEAMRWWGKQGNPPVTMLSEQEWNHAGDVFPIEMLDLRHHHRLLRGAEPPLEEARDPARYRLQIEHDLRTQLLRLRGHYLHASRNARDLEELLLRSFSTFMTLFRHAMVAAGEPYCADKEQALAAAAARFGFDAAPLEAILSARRSHARLAGGKIEALRALFAGYLAAIQRLEHSLEEMDNGNR